jgi:hypothetical protein
MRQYRLACRHQVREYVPPAEGVELSLAQTEQLKRDVEHKKAALEQWCKTAYGEVSHSRDRTGTWDPHLCDPLNCT